MASSTQLAYRTSKDVGIIEGSPTYTALHNFERPEGNIRCYAYSPCGRYFAWALPERVTVVDAGSGQIVTTLSAQNVFELAFSPFGTYVITWERLSKDEHGDAVKNLKVWKVDKGEPDEEESDGDRNIVGRFVQKSVTGCNLQYTHDERYCARTVTNEVHFYASHDLGTVWNKLRVEGVTGFAVAQGESHAIAVFIPERKGLPASVRIYNVPDFEAPVSQKYFFKGDKVQLKWNQNGTCLIVLAQTDVDKTGKSYYGETTLYLMSSNGGFDSRIDLDKEGPIHDVTWSPRSNEFGVVYGYMPAKTTLFNTKAEATHNFPLGPRNTILFSPHGRFVLVAGFGNLAGQMDIYDLERDNARISTVEASNASVCEWSPDGKHILTATTSPRLRVDNGIKVWHIGGELMYTKDLQELYHVTWRPQPPRLYPVDAPLDLKPSPHISALEFVGNVKTPTKPAGAYRPPGARGQVTPLAFKREDEGGAAYVSNGSLSHGISASSFGRSRRRGVPGAEAADDTGQPIQDSKAEDESLSKTAAKNKKKREAKKAKDAIDKPAATDARTSSPAAQKTPSRAPRPERVADRQKSKAATVQTEIQPEIGDANSTEQVFQTTQTATADEIAKPAIQEVGAAGDGMGVGGVSPHDKKIRALLKKLRAIDDLRMRRAGGEKLEGTQIKKMDTEEAVRRELEDLGYQDQ